jgi:hypothetical protein
MALLSEMLENRRHRPFVAHVLFVLVVVEHEIRVVFIYSVVSQMLAHIVQIRLWRRDIGLGGKPCQSFVVHIQAQRFNACKKHINSQIEFKAVYQVRLWNVSLNDVVLAEGDFSGFTYQKYSSSLTACLRFYYVSLVKLIFKLCTKFICVWWENPTLREKIKRFEFFLHFYQVLR